jgi:hypothetical protein
MKKTPKVATIYGAAVKTQFLGPTNSRGSRIKVTPLGSGKGITVPYDHALSATQNHERAASTALGTTKLSCADNSSSRHGGFVFIQRK